MQRHVGAGAGVTPFEGVQVCVVDLFQSLAYDSVVWEVQPRIRIAVKKAEIMMHKLGERRAITLTSGRNKRFSATVLNRIAEFENSQYSSFLGTATATISHLRLEGYPEFENVEALIGKRLKRMFQLDDGEKRVYEGTITKWIDRGMAGEGFQVIWSDGEASVLNVSQLVEVLDEMDEREEA